MAKDPPAPPLSAKSGPATPTSPRRPLRTPTPTTLLLTLALALAAVAGNRLGFSLHIGMEPLLGSTAVLMALAWLGRGPGLAVALVGGVSAWLLNDNPAMLAIWIAEAAAIGWHRERFLRRGRTPPPLAVSAVLFWAPVGVPLCLLLFRVGLGIDWSVAWLLALKHALNGILDAALAMTLLMGVELLRRRRAALPLTEILFASLLVAMLVPALTVAVWQNRDMKERLELRQAERLRAFAALAADARVQGGEPLLVEKRLEELTLILARWLPSSADLRVWLESGPAESGSGLPAGSAAGPDTQPQGPLPTSVPDLSLIRPAGQGRSPRVPWPEARYRMEIPMALPGSRALLTIEVSNRPLVQQARDTATRVLAALNVMALIGVLAAHWLSRRLAAPLERLAATASALPAAIREDRPWSAPPSGPLAEAGQLADAVTEMGSSLAASFRALRAEKDEQARQRELLDFQAQTLSSLVTERDDERAFAERLCRALESRLPGHAAAFFQLGVDGSPQILAAPEASSAKEGALDRVLCDPQCLGCCGRAMQTASPVSISDAGAEPLCPRRGAGAAPSRHSCFAVPILGRERAVLGALAIASPSPAAPAPVVRALLDLAATLAGAALESVGVRWRHEVLVEALSQAGTGVTVARRSGEDFLLVFVNRGFESLTGYRAEELLGRDLRLLQGTDRNQPGRGEMREALDAGRSCRTVLRNYRKDGTLFWSELELSPMRDSQGKIVYYIGIQQDVTDRRRAAEALHAQEERYRLVMDNVEDLVIRVDMEGRFELANPAYCRTFGVAEEGILGRMALPEIHPDDREATARALEELKRPPYTCTVEHRARTVRGWRWLQWVDRTLLDGAGLPIGVVAVGRDIHERKGAEAALRESEQRFRTLFETMGEGVFYQAANGLITDANPAAERILGVSLQDLRTRDSHDPRWRTIREDGTPLPAEEHPSMVALRTGQAPGETVVGVHHPHSDRTRWVQVNARPETRPGETKPYRVFATFSDITRLKTAELQLSAILEGSPHGIVHVQPATRRILWSNAAMRRLFGYEVGELEGQPIDCLHPPEAMARVLLDFARKASGEDLTPASDLPCQSKDGRLFYCTIAAGLARLGPETQLIAFFTDVTEEYQARRALERSEQALLKAQEQAHLGSWELEIATERLTWSPEVYRIFELDPEPGALVNAQALARVHPDEREGVLAAYRKAVAEHAIHDLVHRLSMPDGRIKWVHERCETVYGPDGIPQRSFGTVQDISVRIAAELALADERRRLANVIEATRVGTWEWEIPTGRVALNERWAELIGYRLDELCPATIETWRGLTHPDDLTRAEALLGCHLSGELESFECEIRMRHRDGYWVWIADHGRVIERDTAGAPLVMAGVHRDIGERKRAELALIEREAMMGELLAIAARFLHGSDRRLDALIRAALARVGRFTQSDRCRLYGLDGPGGALTLTAEWCDKNIPGSADRNPGAPLDRLAGFAACLRAGEAVVVDRVAGLDGDWSAERALWESQGLQSVLAAALSAEGRLIGFIALEAVSRPRDWSRAEVRFLQVLATILSGATMRARAIADLRASNDRYDELARQSRTLAWEIDAQGHYTYVSPVCEEVLGYRPEELIGRPCWELYAQAERESARAAVQELLRSHTRLKDFFSPMLARDGRTVWMATSGVPILTPAGGFLGYRGNDTDITERYLDQERIQESEAHLSIVFENAPIGIALVGADRRLGLVNRALGVFLGRAPAELAGMSLDSLIHPDDLDSEREDFAALLLRRTGAYRRTQRYLRPSGDIVWGDLRVALLPTRAGEAPMPLIMIEDITELQEATERQRALEAALADYADQLKAVVDIANLSLPTQDQIHPLLQLSCQGLGLSAAILGAVEDGGRQQRTLAAYRKDLRTGEPRLTRGLVADLLAHAGAPRLLAGERLPRCVRALGLRSCVGIAFPGPRPDGGADTLILALWGTSPTVDLREPECQILRLIAERIGAVRYRERMELDLVESRERETIGHLASGVAHDFNNLLGVIDANIYYLNAALRVASADPEIREVLDETRSALGHAKVVTSGMLALSRVGGVPLEPVDLGKLVGELERILRHVLPATIKLQIAIESVPDIWSSGTFLQSALLNLALNARDAMPEGGILRFSARESYWDGAVPLAAGNPPAMDCVELCVSDTGCGIESAILGRIFDPLFSTKTKRRGHGLGLFMVQEIVVRSGAGLAVESAPGQGTRFRLFLPTGIPSEGQEMPTLARSERAGTGEPMTSPLAGLRVLVVDDDPRVRDSVARLLALDGARTGLAEHGRSALELLDRGERFDLVLSDIAMPEVDGIELLKRLARERPGLPVVLMTGQAGTVTDPGELRERPTVLRKPLDPLVLRAAVLGKTTTRG